MVNQNPDGLSFFPNLLYLLVVRPLYVIGFVLFIIPIILKTKETKPLRLFLGHKYWIPLSRLTFGVFLSNSVFIQFTVFNLEQGIWADKYETNLRFLGFLTLSFLFSLLTYLFIEAPFANILTEFFRARLPQKSLVPYAE